MNCFLRSVFMGHGNDLRGRRFRTLAMVWRSYAAQNTKAGFRHSQFRIRRKSFACPVKTALYWCPVNLYVLSCLLETCTMFSLGLKILFVFLYEGILTSRLLKQTAETMSLMHCAEAERRPFYTLINPELKQAC